MKIITFAEVEFSDEERVLLDKVFDLVAKITESTDYCHHMSCSVCPFGKFCCTSISELEDYINEHLEN